MEKSACISQVKDFIQDVVDYYRRCHVQPSGPLTITRQMASFALPELDKCELDACLRMLEAKGDIAIVNKDQMTFIPLQKH